MRLLTLLFVVGGCNPQSSTRPLFGKSSRVCKNEFQLFFFPALPGVAAASRHSPFQTGTHYTFKYEGRMLSGLPELATHYSGLGIKCIIHLQVLQFTAQYAVVYVEREGG